MILGMHRSGTSLIAHFVHAIGVDLGQDLMPADKANEAGYWESRKIWETHQEILKELDCDWHNPPLTFPADWWRETKIQELRSNLLEFVRSECNRTDKIWGFKDPRTAILLPMWQEIFDELQLEPFYILSVRRPGSVAASLSKRDRLASFHSQALWLRTNLDVLSHTRNNLRAIVDYDRWFDSGLEQARMVVDSLNLSQSVNETQILEAFNQVIRPGLRHHSGEKDEMCSPVVAKFYSLLCRAATEGKIPDQLSEITTTFEKSMQFLSIWNDLVTERDAIIAERDATIAKRDITIESYRTRLRKQRQLFTYIIISIVAIFSLIFAFVLVGSHK